MSHYQSQILKILEKHTKLDILNFSFKAILLWQSFFPKKYNSLKPPKICHKKTVFYSFFEIWVSLSMGNRIFQKMWICVLHPKTCDKIRKNEKIRFFWKKLENNETFEEICLLGDILFFEKTGFAGSGFPESAKIDHFETPPTCQNWRGGSLCFFHI